MAEKLLTIREVSIILGISEKEVVELSERGVVPAYKVGGVYLRFRQEQIEHYQNSLLGKAGGRHVSRNSAYTPGEHLRDFFYFYDFYILSAILIAVLLAVIIKG